MEQVKETTQSKQAIPELDQETLLISYTVYCIGSSLGVI